jgi:hypothetical protein
MGWRSKNQRGGEMSSFKKPSPVPDSLVDGVWNKMRREENFQVEPETTAQDIMDFFDKKRKKLERTDKTQLKYGFKAIDTNREEFHQKLITKLNEYKQKKIKIVRQRKNNKWYIRGHQRWSKEEQELIDFRKTMPRKQLIYEAYMQRFQSSPRTRASVFRHISRRRKL